MLYLSAMNTTSRHGAQQGAQQGDWLDNLRRQPPEVRKNVARLFALGVTAVVAGGWLFVHVATGGLLARQPAASSAQEDQVAGAALGTTLQDVTATVSRLIQAPFTRESATTVEVSPSTGKEEAKQGSEAANAPVVWEVPAVRESEEDNRSQEAASYHAP